MSQGCESVVSFDDEPLILVDENNRVLGYDSKVACHRGSGQLHRAYSIFVFNRRNELLLQQRSPMKPLWPLFWSNSCCSHPRRGESEQESVQRRLEEELTIAARPEFLYQFRYHVSFGDIGSEHELCSVYIARWDEPVVLNPTEVADYCYIQPEVMDRELAEHPGRYTPWLKLEWPRLRNEFWSRIEKH
ncbi:MULTISPECIES: isopentenyl-diphosphate Delta-isomerase [Halomonadaceae]|uniref:Isopentenyl-diphosphate Delta-isomerase n=1 Tax=Vreelandella halophila TaxID=86177 RepID=A0A9X4Y972_9GAMM|nr:MULTISPECIES: isopentenyl-diphosphate Delta-isomerase [Halomonas]MYL25321.1 isopentenyl-diphosphate Delta-isomerase [Halomonas utahensis]MYL75206.1 isopentenyl-diphosphate Delta-isomerase [Halomonas sp. 22501_18_FS]